MKTPYPESPAPLIYTSAAQKRRPPIVVAVLLPLLLLGSVVALAVAAKGLLSSKGDSDLLPTLQQSSSPPREVCSVAVADDGDTWAYGCAGFGTGSGVWFFSKERNGWMIAGELRPEERLLEVRTPYRNENGPPRDQLQNLREGAESLQYVKSRDAFVWISQVSGRLIASRTRDTSYTRDGAVVVEARKYEGATVLHHFRQAPACLAISPDGALIAVGLETWPRYPEDESLTSSQAQDYLLLLKWGETTAATSLSLRGMAYSVQACAFSPDGTLLATGGNDSKVRIWRVSDGHQLDEFSVEAPVKQISLTAQAERILYCTERGHVVLRSRDGTMIRQFHELVADPPRGSGRSLRWTAVAFSPDGSLFAYLCDDLVVCDTASCESLAQRELEGSTVRQIAWSPSGRRLAVGFSDAVYLLDVKVRAGE